MNHAIEGLNKIELRLLYWALDTYNVYHRIWAGPWWFTRNSTIDAYFWK